MKRILSYILALTLFASVSTSCDGVLNIDPTDRYSPVNIWGNKEALDQYVYGFYSIMKENVEIYNAAKFTDAYSDIMKSGSWDQYNHAYNVVLLQESQFNSDNAGAFECWSDMYTRIRRYNEFLRDAETYRESLGDDFINPRIAEVRFLRGYAYYHLIRVYGGVVIRTSVDGPDQNDKPRSTEEESWNQAIQDIRFAAENLPASWTDGAGRITNAAAYGMLSRIAVFAKRWDLAIEAADKCAENGGQLYTAAGVNSYADVFNNSSNPELLIVVNFLPGYSNTGLSHRADTFFRPIGDRKKYGNANIYGAFGPTSELVDSYEVKNADGEWVDFSWDTFGADPYANRDPRFYATVLYNGAKWEGRTLETFVGGADGMVEFKTSNTTGATPTGYYFKKYLTEDDGTNWNTKGSSKYGIHLRFAEVLLNKAEALAEADWGANQAAALEIVNSIRARAGLPAKSAASKDQFMELLRNERKIELAGEGFRYWDLRRWRIAEEVIHGKVAHGVKITKDASTGGFKYEHVSVDADRTRIFFPRFYAFSIPVSERSNNAAFGENNPGW